MNTEAVIEKYYIEGVDFSPEVNLADGYVSLWKNSYGNRVHVFSFYCPDSEKFYYEVIPEQTVEDILMDYVDDIKEEPESYRLFLDCVGLSVEDLEIENQTDVILFLTDFTNYYGEPFGTERLKSADTLEELLKDITQCEKEGVV